MASRYLDTSCLVAGHPRGAKVLYLLNGDAGMNEEPNLDSFLGFLAEHGVTAGKLARMGIRARRALLLASGKARPSADEEATIRARFERGPRAA